MKIWFVSHYAMPPKYEMREKTQKFAQFFKNIGHEVLLVTASTIHGSDINLISDNRAFIEAEYDGLKYLHIRCSNYTGNGLSRIVNMLEFGWRLKRNIGKFDIPNVIVADVNCINYRAIADICKKYNIRFIIDIRDLWPLSIVEYLNISEKNPIIKYLYHREKSMYIRADEIIFSMEGGWDYIVDKGWTKYIDKQKVHHINNGVDLAAFERNCLENVFIDSDIDDQTTFKIVYTGSIRRANNIDFVLDAAMLIKDPFIKFLIWGDGDQLSRLRQRVVDESINNVLFKGKVEKKFIPSIVSRADATFFILENSLLFRFGLSLNKSFEYLAAGKPQLVVGNAKYTIMDNYQCGIHVRKVSEHDFAEAVQYLANLDSAQYERMCRNARNASSEYDYPVLCEILYSIIGGGVRI